MKKVNIRYDQDDWRSMTSAPKNKVILTDKGTARYVDPRHWGSPVRRGWYLCCTAGDIPTCSESGMAISAIEPTCWRPMPQRPLPAAVDAPNKPNIDLRTIHEAQIQWWWKDSHLHNVDYHISVNDGSRAELARLCKIYDVGDDTSYCCQWEGLQIVGTNLEQVTKASKKLASYMRQFKHIQFI